MAHVIKFINERIDLSKYGDSVESITYSPTISEKLSERHRSNKNEYLKEEKRWFLSIDLDYHKALQMGGVLNPLKFRCKWRADLQVR